MKKSSLKKFTAVTVTTAILFTTQTVYGGSRFSIWDIFKKNYNSNNNETTTIVETTTIDETTENTTIMETTTAETTAMLSDTTENSANQEIKKYLNVTEEETTSKENFETDNEVVENIEDVDSEWSLVWSDEFNGDALDTSKWSYQIGNGYNGWGNYEQQYYTEDNVSVSDGTLKITAKEENINGYNYTSGRIRTVTDDGETLFGATYGKFEARIKMPEGQGLWPAFWMMPVDSEYGSWPLSGEIDIMEARGRVLDSVSGTIHFGEKRPFDRSLGGSYTFSEGSDITGFHTYGVEWNENTIIWYVDGVEYYRTSNWYTENDGVVAEYPAPFNKDFYLILNMAVGGNYDNYVTPLSEDVPATMEVDYVRVYQKNDGYKSSDITMPEGTRDEVAMNTIEVDETGNILGDVNFDNINMTAIDTSKADFSTNNWYFLNNTYFGGKADLEKVEINGKNYVQIDVEDSGTQKYSVQLKHNLPLAKGYVYNIIFEAKSLDDEKSIYVKPVGSSAKNNVNYDSSYVARLTNDMQIFKTSFMMDSDTDLDAMLEINLGGTTGSLIIGNITVTVSDTYVVKQSAIENLVETEEVVEAEIEEISGSEKAELSNDNVIKSAVKNGNFSDGLTSWNVYATDYALETRDGNVYGKVYTKPKTNAYDKMMLQSGIYLTKGETYEIEFRTKSSADNQTFEVKLEDQEGKVSLDEIFVASTEWKTVRYSFTAETDSELTLKYLLGMVSTECKLYLDDVQIAIQS